MVFSEGGLGIASSSYTRKGKTYNDGGGVAAGALAEPIPEPLCGNFDIILDHFLRGSPATCHPTPAVGC